MWVASLGASLAPCGGIAIAVNTVLCRQMNDAGVRPSALVAVRCVGALVVVAFAIPFTAAFMDLGSPDAITGVVGASLLLVVFPIYVNQIGISLASPLTVRVVLALGPVLIFVLQVVEGRLASSQYSLAAAVLYGTFAASGAVIRRRAIGALRRA